MTFLTKRLDALATYFGSNRFAAVAVIAAAIAFATTPIAFVFLGRMKWFAARRGRTLQRPDWWTVVIASMLCMAVPAIFLVLIVKSQYYDKDRYEFDPNHVWSVVDQGRQYEVHNKFQSLTNLDKALKAEQSRLEVSRNELLNGVKKLDTAMLALRESARQNPAVIPQLNNVLAQMGGVRKAVGLDAPQQLMNLTADPAALSAVPVAVMPKAVANQPAPAVVAAPATVSTGLAKAEVDAIILSVPAPQKPLATMLPLGDIPGGFVLAKLPGKIPVTYIETFNADNLFEKIDGRAESFIQYGVKGMACCSYHPPGNEDDEIQLFVFEMGDSLKARGKFDSEKPEEAKSLTLGASAYTSAGSVFFYADKYYTIVNVAREDPKLAAFALDVAKKVAAFQTSAKGSGPSPDDIFGLLPAEPKKSAMKYVAKDVFGYSFLNDVFLADYEVGEMKFQGFLRPYATADEAKKIFEEYVATAKKDGAEVKEINGTKADKMVISSNIGLFDVVFLKGNTVGGSNGATEVKPAEAFAKAFANSMPATVPILQTPKGAKEEDPEVKH